MPHSDNQLNGNHGWCSHNLQKNIWNRYFSYLFKAIEYNFLEEEWQNQSEKKEGETPN